jgi:hypothetical protein
VVDQFGAPLPMLGRYGQTRAQLLLREAPIDWPEGLQATPAKDVETELLRYAGARPWDRDADDIRILFFIAEGRGTIINDEREVSSYPKVKMTQAAFNEQDWDMANGIPKAASR